MIHPMPRSLIAAALATVTLAAGTPAAAQVRGIPVYNSGVPTGVTLAGELGFPSSGTGGGVAFGGSARFGFGPLGATAMVIESKPGGNGANFLSFGGTANFKLLGGPLIPLSATLQGGIGYSRNPLVAQPLGTTGDRTELRFPIGLGIALSLPNPVLAIKPWIAPRVDVIHVSTENVAVTTTAFAISGGIEFNLLNGLGLHTGYDWSRRDGVTYGTFGVGLHYGIRLPGF